MSKIEVALNPAPCSEVLTAKGMAKHQNPVVVVVARKRVRVLYERCLVACALYEHLWIRYAKYLEVGPIPMSQKLTVYSF